MKKKILYIIFASLCIILLIKDGKTARGAVLIDTTQNVSTSTLQNACTATDAGGYTQGGSLLSVKMGKIPFSIASGSITIIFWSSNWDDFNISNYANFSIGSTTYSTFSTPPQVTFSPDNSFSGFTKITAVLTNVTAQEGDFITLNVSLGNQWRQNCISVLPNATSTYVNSINGGDNTRYWDNPYFILIDNQNLNFYIPTNGITTNDFNDWKVSGLDLSTTSTYRIDVIYNMVGSPTQYDDFNLQNSTYSYGIFTIHKNNLLWFPPLATTTQWNATAYLYICNPNDLSACASTDFIGNAIATTTISFFVNAPTPPPTTTSTPSYCNFTQYSFWIDPFGNTENAICNAFVSMFTLTESDTQNLSNKVTSVYSQIQKKPPFGFFNSISNAIGSMGINSSTNQLINSSSSASFGKIFSPLKDGISVLFGLLFSFWLIWRISHFEL